MFYVGNTFDKKVNKGYKTIKNAKKEAEKNGLSVCCLLYTSDAADD